MDLKGKKKPGREEKSVADNPDFEAVDRELERKGVTLLLVWQEWSKKHPEQYYGYATFCRRLNRWRRHNRVTLRQAHHPAEKLFVDYAGVRVSIITEGTGAIREVPVFVAVLGASYYKYAEVTETAEMSHWLGSHVRAFDFYGGLPKTVVIDNLKTGVTASCRYDPILNRSYREFAEHYRIAILPARVRKPRDKAVVEKAVQDVERSVLAPLRDTLFYSVAEANQKIGELLSTLNERKMRDYGESSLARFERFEVRLRNQGAPLANGERGDILYRLAITVPAHPHAAGILDKAAAIDAYAEEPVRRTLPSRLIKR